MKMQLELGRFSLQLQTEDILVARRLSLHMETPWGDITAQHELDRSKVVQLCLLCDNPARRCECEEQLLINPHDASAHLVALDHEMYHFLTETECGEEEQE